MEIFTKVCQQRKKRFNNSVAITFHKELFTLQFFAQ